MLLHSKDVSSHVEVVQTMVDRMKTTLEEAQDNLSLVENRAKAHADALWLEEAYEVGDEVVLATRHLCVNEHLPIKLKSRWIGPFSIAKVISPVAYWLNLAPNWQIHPVFHVSTLKQYYRSEEFERVERPPSPIVVNGEEEFEVEAILRHKGARHLYQVLWKGYPITEASWEPESHLCNAPQILEEYLHRIAVETSVRRQQQNRGSQRTAWWCSWGFTRPPQVIKMGTASARASRVEGNCVQCIGSMPTAQRLQLHRWLLHTRLAHSRDVPCSNGYNGFLVFKLNTSENTTTA